jgi:HK97 family phage major capsid protein
VGGYIVNLNELREEHATLVAQAEKFSADKATDEEKAEDAKRFARLDELKGLLERQERLAAHAFSKGNIDKPKDHPGKAEVEAVEKFSDIRVIEKNIDRQDFSRQMRNWALTGDMGKYATITTATQSSIFLPKSVLSPLTPSAANSFRAGYEAWGVPIMETTGDTSTFNLPVADATAGGLVAENASSETENTPTLTDSIVSTVKTYQSGAIYYSNLQLSATKFDLLSATVPALDYAKELGLESAIVAAMVADAGITQSTTTATATTFTYANMVAWNNSLPKRYQVQKVMLLSAAAYAAAEGLVDSQGRPILVTDAQNDRVRKIGGTPVVRCDYLGPMTTGQTVGLLFSLVGFHLRDAGVGITRYTQVPAKPNQTGVNEFGYHAYGYAFGACSKLKMA